MADLSALQAASQISTDVNEAILLALNDLSQKVADGSADQADVVKDTATLQSASTNLDNAVATDDLAWPRRPMAATCTG